LHPPFPLLCRDLFLLSHVPLQERGPAAGREWERRIGAYLRERRVPVEPLPGGYRLFGVTSLSQLGHQIDTTAACVDALVVGEWKAHRDRIPKNELLRFKAATDDYYMAFKRTPHLPVMRIFGGGDSGVALRGYAAAHGIALVERARWPAAFLGWDGAKWPEHAEPPSHEDRRRLRWLARPMQRQLVSHAGDFIIPSLPTAASLQAIIGLHDHWSERMWAATERSPYFFERLVERMARLSEAA
jgi:hypothetical protein